MRRWSHSLDPTRISGKQKSCCSPSPTQRRLISKIRLANPSCPRDCPVPSSTSFHCGPDGGQLVGVFLISPHPSQRCDGCKAWPLGLVVACSQERCHLQPALPGLRRDICPSPGAAYLPAQHAGSPLEPCPPACFPLPACPPTACPTACCPPPALPLPAVPCLLSSACLWAGDTATVLSPMIQPGQRGPAVYTAQFRWSSVFSVSVHFRLCFFGQSVLQRSALVLTEQETFSGKGDHTPA